MAFQLVAASNHSDMVRTETENRFVRRRSQFVLSIKDLVDDTHAWRKTGTVPSGVYWQRFMPLGSFWIKNDTRKRICILSINRRSISSSAWQLWQKYSSQSHHMSLLETMAGSFASSSVEIRAAHESFSCQCHERSREIGDAPASRNQRNIQKHPRTAVKSLWNCCETRRAWEIIYVHRSSCWSGAVSTLVDEA